MNNNTILESIKVTKNKGTKTFGMDQIHHNIFLRRNLNDEEKFILNIIRAIYGDFTYEHDQEFVIPTTRIPFWRCVEIFFDNDYEEIEVKTNNHKRFSLIKFTDEICLTFYNCELPGEKIFIRKNNLIGYKILSKEFDKFIDHGRLIEIPTNRCYPDPNDFLGDIEELESLVINGGGQSTKEDIITYVDGVIWHMKSSPLDKVLGRYIAGFLLSGGTNETLKEALRNIFGVVNDQIQKRFGEFGINLKLVTSERLDNDDDNEEFFNTPWFDIVRDGENVDFYDLTLTERDILYIAATIITYRSVCSYFIIEDVFEHLPSKMKGAMQDLVCDNADNAIHILDIEEVENESALRELFPDGPEDLDQMEEYLKDLEK